MASSQSLFLTAVVAMVLGVVIGVVGLIALTNAVSPTADEAASQQEVQTGPQVYGTR
jgi:hypothetical protein